MRDLDLATTIGSKPDLPPELAGANEWEIRLARAMVPITVEIPGGKWMVASGFLVEISNRWFWMTAHHFLDGALYKVEGLRQLASKSHDLGIKLRPVTDPTYGGVALKYDENRVFTPREAADELRDKFGSLGSTVIDLIAELDIACIELGPGDYYIKNLVACGCQPLSRNELWKASTEFLAKLMASLDKSQTYFFIAGMPSSDLVFDSEADLKQVSVKYLPIWPKTAAGPELEFEPSGWENLHQDSVRGMSGGPAFAVIDGQVYWFGVQSKEIRVDGKPPTVLKIALATVVFHFMEAIGQILGGDRRDD